MNVSRSELSKALKRVSVAVSNNNILPVYEQVLFQFEDGKLSLTVLSADTMMVTSIPVEKCEKESFSMKAKQILQLVEKITGDMIDIKRDKDSVKIKSGKFKATYDTFNVDDFPQKLALSSTAVKFQMNTNDVIEALKYTTFCCSSEQQTNPALKYLLMKIVDDKAAFVATDSKRMSVVSILGKFGCNSEILIGNISNILKNSFGEFETLSFAVDGTKLSITTDNTVYIMALPNIKYPDYQRVLPNETEYKKFEIKKDVLQNALDLVTIRDSATPDVVWNVESNVLTITKIENKVVVSEDEVECKYDGKKLDICISAEYVKQLLKVYDKDDVVVMIKNENSPLIVLDEKMKHIVMPLKINK